ncbi:MAG TPA: hypothetical protein VLD65_03215, partial [Anaerolineales bacterium]|nr:hypothetical protein [Anaerolineales bacterium]
MLKDIFVNPLKFSEILFEKMKSVNPGISDLELYEFRYGLDNIEPVGGNWLGIQISNTDAIEKQFNDINFYQGIQIKRMEGNRVILDPAIVSLTRMLFVGLVSGDYPVPWVKQNFYFDIRGFYFLHRTSYFTDRVNKHLRGRPFLTFDPKQRYFETKQDIGYKDFKQANAEVDHAFITSVKRIIASK